jgi:Lar family restriction alleviation protein
MTEYGRIHTDGSRSGGQPVLKPCPFCGGQAGIAEIETEDLPLWLGECQEPPCEAVAPVRPTRDEAIAAWNTRQPTQSDAASFLANIREPSAAMIEKGYEAFYKAEIPQHPIGVAFSAMIDAALQEQSK